MSKKRTIAELLSPVCAIDIYLENEEIATRFIEDAEKEGFVIDNNIVPHDHMWVCIHEDKRVTYPGCHTFCGTMAFHHNKMRDNKIVVKIDYMRYKRGDTSALFRHESGNT